MSKYTVEIRHICDLLSRQEVESWFKDYELSDYLTSDEIDVINERGTWTKDKLAKKIVDFYFTREIGDETIGLFKLHAKTKMNLIMESKLPLIYSAAIKYDPLVNVDFTETINRNANDSSNGLTISSDTPQGQISKTEILEGKFATNTQGGENSSESSEDTTRHMKGNSGVSATAQAMVKQYRENIRDIDYEIIEELKDLFIGLL